MQPDTVCVHVIIFWTPCKSACDLWTMTSLGTNLGHSLLLLLLLLLSLTKRLTWRLVQKLQGHVTYQKKRKNDVFGRYGKTGSRTEVDDLDNGTRSLLLKHGFTVELLQSVVGECQLCLGRRQAAALVVKCDLVANVNPVISRQGLFQIYSGSKFPFSHWLLVIVITVLHYCHSLQSSTCTLPLSTNLLNGCVFEYIVW